MKIYAEWTLYDQFHSGFFYSWEMFYKATFCPDCEILTIKEFK